MDGPLLALRPATCNKDRTSGFVKLMVGQRASSHGGKFAYRRKGLLASNDHNRVLRDGAIAWRAVQVVLESSNVLYCVGVPRGPPSFFRVVHTDEFPNPAIRPESIAIGKDLACFVIA